MSRFNPFILCTIGKTIAEDELRVAIIRLVKQARVQIKAR